MDITTQNLNLDYIYSPNPTKQYGYICIDREDKLCFVSLKIQYEVKKVELRIIQVFHHRKKIKIENTECNTTKVENVCCYKKH